MQHKNMFTVLSFGDVFSKSFWAGQPKNFNVRVVYSEKSGKMYILTSATFAAFWRVSLLCCFSTTAVYRVWAAAIVAAGQFTLIQLLWNRQQWHDRQWLQRQRSQRDCQTQYRQHKEASFTLNIAQHRGWCLTNDWQEFQGLSIFVVAVSLGKQ
jgi:hypothetical protein